MTKNNFILYTMLWMSFTACETIISVDLPDPEPMLIVEGYIENDVVPYVLLSRNAPFFGGFNINDLESAFVSGGDVKIVSSTDTIQLIEYTPISLSNASVDVQEVILPIISQIIGFKIDADFLTLLPNLPLYSVGEADLDFVGKLEEKYSLIFEVNDSILGFRSGRAEAYIPPKVDFDSLWTRPHPREEIDSLVELRGRFKDPDTLGNFYRILTAVNNSLWLSRGSTVFDDPILNGKSIPFSIFKGRERFNDEDFDPDVTGYWSRGDTARVKFSTLNLTHYRFWRTVENEVGNAGNPFASFTIVASNIVGEGVFGIWGGYGTSIMSLPIPE